MATIDPKHIITLKNKQFVLFAGLLDLAHNMGLVGVETHVCPELCDLQQQSFVVKATGRFSNEKGGQVFSAYGDASPQSSQMRGAYLRHAETRAMARMLRVATNVGMCSAEEIDEPSMSAPPAHHQDRQEPTDSRATAPQRQGRDSGVTPASSPARNASQAIGCAVCGQVMTKSQSVMSQRLYQRNLCPEHQRKAAATIANHPAV